MKRTFQKIAVTSMLSLSLITGSLMLNTSGALAAVNSGAINPMNQQRGGMMNNSVAALADTASEIVSGTATNSAADLAADTENATLITVTDESSQVKITESGTYIVTGSASDGSITVKKGTTGVVLILEDLDLTSTTGAAVSVNKESEVQIVVSGSVTLTDAEDPADENSQDAEVAEAYDGAAIKIKAGSSVYLTGDGTLTVNGSAKNGIKTGDEATLVIDGADLTVDITAVNDGINANYDLTIASGTVTISAADDALHADRVLTLGSESSEASPTVTITRSTEGLEGTVVNIFSGTFSVTSSDDAINAANSDDTYSSEMDYAINITGGNVTISSRSDGLDSNGNINLTGGAVTILNSANNGGDAGIDYDGQLYISGDADLNNSYGIAGPDGMPGGGMMDGMMGQMGGQMNGQMGNQKGQRGMDWNGQTALPDQNGNAQTAPDAQQDTDLNSQATPSHETNVLENWNGQMPQGGQMDWNGQTIQDGGPMNQRNQTDQNGFGRGFRNGQGMQQPEGQDQRQNQPMGVQPDGAQRQMEMNQLPGGMNGGFQGMPMGMGGGFHR